MEKQIRIIFLMLIIIFILGVLWIALVFGKNLMIDNTTTNSEIPNLLQTKQGELAKEKKLYKSWRTKDDPRQEIVNETYKLGGIDDVVLFECEWYDRDMYKKGDKGNAVGLCQMNRLYNDIPAEYYTDRRVQIEYCHEKRQGGTLFYGPDRADGENGEKCMSYAKRRFYLE